MRTLVISDLHLGNVRGTDVLRRRGPLEALCMAVADVERLVLLGDTLELRHAPVPDVVEEARPVLSALGEALGPGGELVIVTGNHDHHLISPWLEDRAFGAAPGLSLDEEVPVRASTALAAIAEAAAPARVRVRFPGLWLRDDVYAIHGHYLDRLITLPSFERLALGAMSRVVGPVPEGRGTARPEDFEAALQPLYAWMHAVAQSPAGTWSAKRQRNSADTWQVLSGEAGAESGARISTRGRARTAVMRAAFPVAVRVLHAAGLGPLNHDISGVELRRAGLRAMRDVVWRLGVDAEHVVFGHTHRSGPHPGDASGEWRVSATDTKLHNTGCWVEEPVFATGGPGSPYWAGRGIYVDESGPPRLERIVTDLG